ncbi:MAG: GNAT family N-acetyltransferase [Clostridiales bacterium]|nr:GNAT family N-acetyltransferase [Clostridiales bacterium]
MMKDLGMKKLETDRLILRKITLDDGPQMFENWASDVKTTSYLSWPTHKTLKDTRAVIHKWVEAYSRPLGFNWGIQLKETGELIGNIEVTSKNAGQQLCQIAFCIGSKWWNNGYATEACKAVLDFLLNHVGFYVVESQYLAENPAAGKVLMKAGMIKDGVMRKRYMGKTEPMELVMIRYSIIKSELFGAVLQ